jgi:hypothetical protein
MALKPIDPGSSATELEKKAYREAQDHARTQPHLWANGPEHRMPAQAPSDSSGVGNPTARHDGRR